MARFNPHHNSTKLYPEMREFATECLLRDGSVLRPGQSLWTADPIFTRYAIGAKNAPVTLSVATLDVTRTSRQHIEDL